MTEITYLLQKEYSLRYRMVEVMWKEFPEACFVYQKEEKILGVSFNKIQAEELYMRQIFVREGCRGEKVGTTLYQARLEYARQHRLKVARAHVRDETLNFHAKHGAITQGSEGKYVIKGI